MGSTTTTSRSRGVSTTTKATTSTRTRKTKANSTVNGTAGVTKKSSNPRSGAAATRKSLNCKRNNLNNNNSNNKNVSDFGQNTANIDLSVSMCDGSSLGVDIDCIDLELGLEGCTNTASFHPDIMVKQEPISSPETLFPSPTYSIGSNGGSHSNFSNHTQHQNHLSFHSSPSDSPCQLQLDFPAQPTTNNNNSSFSSISSILQNPNAPPSPVSTLSPTDLAGSPTVSTAATNSSKQSKKSTASSASQQKKQQSQQSQSQSQSQQQQSTVDPTTGKPKTTKRRPHSKSRHGCKTCKRRRVKCDETHPICNNCKHLNLECSFAVNSLFPFVQGGLNIMDIRLFHHYTTTVWKTIVLAGISNEQIWSHDVPEMAFDYPFLMHSVLTFAANHFSRTNKADHDPATIEQVVTFHRGDALKLLGEAVRNVTPKNLDALVASSILLILDALANASSPDSTSPSSLPASAWLHHVRGAATILTAVGPPTPESRFYRLVNVDLSDLAQGLITSISGLQVTSSLECFDEDLQDLYPVNVSSPYYHALSYLDKLFRQRYKSDFILRVFSFPALLDKNLLSMLINGDEWAKRIIRVYYKLVRSFTSEMKESVWFLEGVSKILPIDMDKELGGLGFITQALPLNLPSVDDLMDTFFNTTINDISIFGPSATSLTAATDSTRSTNNSTPATSTPISSVGISNQTSNQQSTNNTNRNTNNPSPVTLAGLSDAGSISTDIVSTGAFDLDLLGNPNSDLASLATQFMMQTASGATGTNNDMGNDVSGTSISSSAGLLGAAGNGLLGVVGSHSPPNSPPLSLSSNTSGSSNIIHSNYNNHNNNNNSAGGHSNLNTNNTNNNNNSNNGGNNNIHNTHLDVSSSMYTQPQSNEIHQYHSHNQFSHQNKLTTNLMNNITNNDNNGTNINNINSNSSNNGNNIYNQNHNHHNHHQHQHQHPHNHHHPMMSNNHTQTSISHSSHNTPNNLNDLTPENDQINDNENNDPTSSLTMDCTTITPSLLTVDDTQMTL